jgi:hypothetical protein
VESHPRLDPITQARKNQRISRDMSLWYYGNSVSHPPPPQKTLFQMQLELLADTWYVLPEALSNRYHFGRSSAMLPSQIETETSTESEPHPRAQSQVASRTTTVS